MLRWSRIAVLLLICSANAQEYDSIIRNGCVIDGTGNPAFFADIAIKDGRIARIGRIEDKAATEFDAAGFTIAPGFIDVHTHAEEVMELPLAENFLRMGVTTIVLGNCGSSEANVGEFFGKLEADPVSINVATLIGHGTVRGKVMGGSFMRPPTAEEFDRMRSLVERAMRDGALGISTGLIYLPGTFAKTEELIEVAKVASAFDGIYVSHMRDEGNDIEKSLAELFRIAREARIRAEVSHIKLSGKNNWGRPAEVLAAIEKARAEGLDITQDQYAYAASSTGISQLIPDWAREGGKFRERISDPEQKAKIVDEMKSKLARGKRDDFSYAVIAQYSKDRSLNGLNILQAATKKKVGQASVPVVGPVSSPGAIPATLDDQIELIFQIQTNGGASAVFHSMSEDDIRVFMQHPNTMFASDSGMRRYREGVPHPRGYGNNARVLGRYVRELKLLRLEDGIRKMTSLPANTFRIRDRGIVREDAWADLAIFDPAAVKDNATFESPHHYATGFRWVLVNGVAVIDNDAHTKARPGKVVRNQNATKTLGRAVGWNTASPEEVGLDSTALSEMFDYVREHKVPVHSIQIARQGKMALDAYFYPYKSEMRHDVASVTKSITSTLIGLAIQKRLIRDVQQSVLSLFPNRSVANLDANKQRLTLEHLLTMQAGWDCGKQLNDPAINVDWRLDEMRRSADWVQAALDLPMVAEPGTRFAYCNVNCHLLSAIVTKATGTNALHFARRELFEPLGIRDVAWPADPHGHNHGWGDLQLHPHDMVRLGQLFLQGGRWNDRQIISTDWLAQATRIHVERTGGDDQYGYLWWTPGEEYPGVFEAIGRGGQRITVWPAKQLVAVFTGGGFEPGHLAKFILKALKSDAPLAANRDAATHLRKQITAATQCPPAQPVGKLPPVAARVSGRTFRLSANNLGVSALTLQFDDSAQARAELLWNGQRVPFPVGLDGVERFSTNALVSLPQAAKGQWLDDTTFLLTVDLVGAINYYRCKLTFSEDGKSLKAALTERTGLNNEEFEGAL